MKRLTMIPVVLACRVALSLNPAARAGPVPLPTNESELSRGAEFVTWQFAGEITLVLDELNLLEGAVDVGSPFQGTVSFDTSVMDTDPSETEGFYLNAIAQVVGTAGNLAFTGPVVEGAWVNVSNSVLDSFLSQADVAVNGVTLTFQLNLGSAAPFVLEADSIPVLPPDPTLFSFANFRLLSGSEEEPVSVLGTVSTLLPEPATLVLLAPAALYILRPRRRRRRSRRPGVSAGLAILISTAIVFDAQAADCNDNGIDDANELATCPTIQLVFIIDDSGSVDTLDALCIRINQAITSLESQGLTIEKQILTITEGGCSCCTNTVVNLFGPFAPCGVPAHGSCLGDQPNREDWGGAADH